MSQHITVARARAVRARLIAIAEACHSVGTPLPMRDELARITGATRRQIDRHISYLRDIGRITIERRANRAWVGGVAA
jgi:DNA-binding transcriptional ArsR family regulator